MTAKKTTKKLQPKKELSISEINKLVQAGTKEAVAKLESLFDKETDLDKKDCLFAALEEAEMVYYEPTNDQEEKDFGLAKLINDKEEDWFYQDMEAEALECRLDFAELELAVREKMLRDSTGNKKELAQINRDVAHDMMIMYKNQLAEVKEELSDIEAWIQTAQKMLKTKKYQNLPADFFDNYHFDDEDLDGDDDDCCCDCGCCCDDEDDCDCPCNFECTEDCDCEASCVCNEGCDETCECGAGK
ncbi:MAG: hypothetical protein V1716_05830 [Candidatus Uhrbacteria bacterium]